ncbi:hypothetical protein [Mesorhizobium sp. WSM3866]|uniref:hypothetical protein n=1 Tax=Mesorhizobium sp. WSM3866 TaxID=422271 RepID=UPI00159677F7|nr:hypothetical protein [Mesorhizobium sp. WSM3866]
MLKWSRFTIVIGITAVAAADGAAFGDVFAAATGVVAAGVAAAGANVFGLAFGFSGSALDKSRSPAVKNCFYGIPDRDVVLDCSTGPEPAAARWLASFPP